MFVTINTYEMIQSKFVDDQLVPFLNMHIAREVWDEDLEVDSSFQGIPFTSNYHGFAEE